MEITFNLKSDQLLLRADALNYELCKLKQRKDEETGEVTQEWSAFKWYASLPHALSKILEMKVRSSDATTLAQLRKDLEAARSEIMSVWNTDIQPEKCAGKCSCI